jgi:hypothetical protein
MLFKLEPDGHSAKKVPLQFGATSVQLIEIKSGLQPGDRVIISGSSGAQANDALNVERCMENTDEAMSSIAQSQAAEGRIPTSRINPPAMRALPLDRGALTWLLRTSAAR